jgi:hypothetical protein
MGFGFRVSGCGFRVAGFELWVMGFELWVSSLGFGVGVQNEEETSMSLGKSQGLVARRLKSRATSCIGVGRLC